MWTNVHCVLHPNPGETVEQLRDITALSFQDYCEVAEDVARQQDVGKKLAK
jgi:diadenosine tetraphosphate (Ap4A) HIT family hydrolase